MSRVKYDIKELCFVPPPYGGVSVYVRRLIDRLTDDGFIVGGYYSSICSDEKVKNSVLFNEWTWMQTHLIFRKLPKYLKETAPYKIIHSHFSLEGMAYLWAIKVLGRKRIVVTIHNSMNTIYYKQTNVINRFFLKMMLRSKDVTWIAVSEQGKQQLKSFPVKLVTPVYVIPAYIPISDTRYTLLNEEMQAYLDSHLKNIAFYGHSFMINEGIDIYGFKSAIQCYSAILKESKERIGFVLCLAEANDTEKIELLHKYAKSLDVDNKIFWQIGAIDNIRTLWHEVDVYIRPTSTDGDSVAVREVIDEGAHVVASDVCARPEGVITYRFSDDSDFTHKVLKALSIPKNKSCQNYQFYDNMKDVYVNLLRQMI